jgi:hypothetical protein
VPDPPPGVNTNLPPVTEANPQTNRDRMTEHATNPSCASCHKLIDPIGFGFEKFDAVGARRDNLVLQFRSAVKANAEKPADDAAEPKKDAKPRFTTRTIKLEFDTNGEVAGLPDSQFSSPAELGAVLAKSAQCQECIVKQYFRYTAGRPETPADRPVIQATLEDFRNSGYRFKTLIVSLVVQREFPHQEGTAHVPANYKSR